MGAWSSSVGLVVVCITAIWLAMRRNHELRRLPSLLEQLSGRAVVSFSARGRLLGLGPHALRLLGMHRRADRFTTQDLPLEGLDALLLEAEWPEAAATSALGMLILHGQGAPRPVNAVLVPLRPERGGLPALLSLSIDAFPQVRGIDEDEPLRYREAHDGSVADSLLATTAPSATALARDSQPIGPLTGLRVLLAEDSPDNQLLFSYFVQGAGAELVLVENGREAVERAEASSFDIVFLDMQMPIMDGHEAARLIRDLDPHLPIVALTARGEAEHEALCRAAGCTEFLVKPCSRKQLIEIAQKLATHDGERRAVKSNETSSVAADVADDLENDPEFREIVADFIGDLGRRLASMRTALAHENWTELRGLAHQLKGAAGGFGLPEVSDVASILERDATDGAPAAVDTLAELARLIAIANPSLQAEAPGFDIVDPTTEVQELGVAVGGNPSRPDDRASTHA